MILDFRRPDMTRSTRIARLSIPAALVALGVAACGGDASSPAAAAGAGSGNPLATDDQIAAEKRALELVQAPAVIEAKAVLKSKWLAAAKTLGGVPAEAMASLDTAVDETVFSNALSVVNRDPERPKIVSLLAAPHAWFGLSVPGSRTTFDNPDTIYRTFVVDPAASYVVAGHVDRHAPVDVNISLWNSANATLSNLPGQQLATDADGNFTITADASAQGSGNHVQLTPTAASFFIRDTVNDWGVQQFNRLSVKRVPATTTASTVTQDAQAAALAATLGKVGDVFAYYNALAYAQPVNTLPAITRGGANGRLSSQAATYSAFRLADDEALVLSVNLGGAKYFIAPAYNRWTITTDYIGHTQTLNNTQAVADPDGTYTFVVSPSDPGVYNWVDTVGIHEGLLNLRWQGLPDTAGAAPPSASARLVKLRDLSSVLPPTTKYVTAGERHAQQVARAASYASRYTP
ncbi:hypothetical protein [Burkholderia multivorans]|uniref:hypothetical protein n=1 Tax=Burkholderia multivorans TaxID=87883 RepID=UPI0020B44147|nr:hypothetical protein [Burkholderia multivorans]